MRRRLLLATLALAVVGCGGGGSTGGTPLPPPATETEAQVRNHLAFMARTRTKTPDVGIPAPPVLFFGYESRYGLWVRVSQSGATQTRRYYTDQAGTVLAGTATETRTTSGSTTAVEGTINLTAGIMGGHGGTWQAFETESGMSGNSDLWFPSEGRFRVNVSAAGEGWSVQTRQDGINGTWREHAASRATSGQISGNLTSSGGLQIQLLFNADGSGSGSVTGTGTGLPASLAWGVNGRGTLTWSGGGTATVSLN